MKTATKILLAAVSALVMLALIEAGLRLGYRFYADYNTEMWRYAVELKRLSANGKLGHEHVPGRAASLYGVDIRINSRGIRADREYEIPKAAGIKRILMAGDSLTLGWGVRHEDTCPRILEAMLNEKYPAGFEVINLGVGNYGTENELEAIKNNMELQPDMIILNFYINDIEEIRYPSGPAYWFQKNFYIYPFGYDRLVKLKNRGLDYREYYSSLYKDARLRDRFEKGLKEIADIARCGRIPLIFVNIPELHELENYPFNDINKYIEKTVLSLPDAEYLDLLPFLKKNPKHDLWVSPEDVHLNKKANKLVARAIFNRISENEYFK
ncbi:MAG: SGNH/GDSL hydrolase family protein [Elusimicrobia bacterium]|nr:SGNH/GDSL hydrolase family protein [Elusimicrobiota bacterium]